MQWLSRGQCSFVVKRKFLIQERLDAFTIGPLVALEYLLELRDYDATKEPTYLCILCDKKGDPRTVLTHLASYKHILQVSILILYLIVIDILFTVLTKTLSHLLPWFGSLYDQTIQTKLAKCPSRYSRSHREKVRSIETSACRWGQVRKRPRSLYRTHRQGTAFFRIIRLYF